MGHILETTANRSDIDVPRLFDVVIRMQSIYFFPSSLGPFGKIMAGKFMD